ncbi:hypothetical protein [Streptomyces thermocarboxydovorans]
MAVDVRRLQQGKRVVPAVLLSSERADGDSAAALLRYAAWRLPWTLLIVLRYVELRRSLLYAAAVAPHDPAASELGSILTGITARMDASDNQAAWRSVNIRAWLRGRRRSRTSRAWWLRLIPCLLMLPSLVFLGVGSFTSTAGLQEYFTTGQGPTILMGFAIAALAWIAYQLIVLLRVWRQASSQPVAELLATHRFRCGTAAGAATAGTFLLWRGLGSAGPDGRSIETLHLLEALDTFFVYLGFALLLLSLLALFPPTGFALAGGGAVGAITAPAALYAGALGIAGVVLLAVGAGGSGAGGTGGGPRRSVPQWLRDQWNEGQNFNKANWHRYPANEIDLANGKRLDSYLPKKEIVSRKHTQIAEIAPDTFRKYLNEIRQKYRRGVRIADTPKARAQFPQLIGTRLQGKYVLEVPVQSRPVPEWALREAARRRIEIKDVQGNVYRLQKGTG